MNNISEGFVRSFACLFLILRFDTQIDLKIFQKYSKITTEDYNEKATISWHICRHCVFPDDTIIFFWLKQSSYWKTSELFDLLRIYQDRHRLVEEMPSSYPPPLGSHRLAQGNGNPCKHS